MAERRRVAPEPLTRTAPRKNGLFAFNLARFLMRRSGQLFFEPCNFQLDTSAFFVESGLPEFLPALSAGAMPGSAAGRRATGASLSGAAAAPGDAEGVT